MIRTIWFLILIAFISLISVLVTDNPGAVSLNWLGYKVDTSVGVLLSGVLFISICLTIIFRIWFYIKTAPKRVGKAHIDWRRRRGYKALTQGMVAVAAGDAQEARRQARKAENFLADPPLTMLLSAQAAQLSGDEKAAGEFFEKMSERKDTKYLGIHGMLNQAIQEGDKEIALELAEQANDLQPKTDKVSRALFELQVQSGNWEEAEETIRKAVKDKYLNADIGRRRRAAILYQRSVEAEANGKLNDALALAKKANNLTSGFVPAAVRTARLLQGAGKRRKAVSIIEEIWVKNPHPLLSDVIGELSSGVGDQEKMRTVEKLASYNKDHLESHLAIAKFALIAQMWQEAREHLIAASTSLKDGVLPARICRYMAELEEGENHDLEASREWLKKAAVAEPDSAWNCNHCGQIVVDWDPLCKHCETFDSLEWRTPPRVTRMTQVDDDIQSSKSSTVRDKSVDDPVKTIVIEPDAPS
ncbi:MAG: heme biosynthesis HemY N-terminal domain-containing protein [Pseudomonadota bacterium]|nr:heme biosynthesis HemY N-terminal domain-containing protein [Pseudomonadota bacterium]